MAILNARFCHPPGLDTTHCEGRVLEGGGGDCNHCLNCVALVCLFAEARLWNWVGKAERLGTGALEITESTWHWGLQARCTWEALCVASLFECSQ